MNCKNCKHWRRGGSLVLQHGSGGEIVGKNRQYSVVCLLDSKSKMGLCLHPSLGSDYVDDWLSRKMPEKRTDGVYAGCDENRASLNTGEDFGCVHFQHNE